MHFHEISATYIGFRVNNGSISVNLRYFVISDIYIYIYIYLKDLGDREGVNDCVYISRNQKI